MQSPWYACNIPRIDDQKSGEDLSHFAACHQPLAWVLGGPLSIFEVFQMSHDSMVALHH